MRTSLEMISLRAAWWTVRAVRGARRRTARDGLRTGQALPAVPRVPDQASRGVSAAMRLLKPSCLIRAQVLQAWDCAHGRPRDLVIGVTAPGAGFRAHAWLEGDEACEDRFAELTRIPVR